LGDPSSAGQSVRKHAPSGGSAAPATTAQGRIATSETPCGSASNAAMATALTTAPASRIGSCPRRSRSRPSTGEHTAFASAFPPDARPAAAKEPVSSFVRSTSTSDSAVAGARPTIDAKNSRAESPPRRTSNT
jgi:hypothetical protein